MKINENFREFFFDYNTMFSILYGGAGSGKSVVVTQKLITKCLISPRRVLVLRQTGVSLNDSVIRLFKDILSENNIPYKYNVQDRLLYIGESIVMFKATEDPERIKSIAGITDIWIEEATEVSPDLFLQLVLRLRTMCSNLQYTITFNPIHKSNWVYPFFFDSDAPEYFLENKSYIIHKSTYRDNAFLPSTYVQNLLDLKKSNPHYFSIYAEGEWGTLGKLVFPYGSYTIKSLDIPTNGLVRYIDGLDLGWNDPNALACSAVWHDNDSKRDILYTYNTWSASEVTTDVIAQKIKDYCGNRVVYGDNAAAAQIAEIQKKGCYNLRPNKKPPGSVLATINTIKQFDWYIDPKCEDLIRELGIYAWKKDQRTGLYLEEPERGSGSTHVNVIDGVRYSLEGLSSLPTTISAKSIKSIKGLL